MDLSVARVLEALAPGPAAVGILSTRYGMDAAEAEEALAHCVDEGLAEPAGPIAYRLTALGAESFAHLAGDAPARRAAAVGAELAARDAALRAHDVR